MKVICFTDSLVSGGAQRQLVNIAILLKEKGYDVSFLIYRNILFFKTQLDQHNIDVVLINAETYIGRLMKVRSYFKKSSADIIISFLETPNFIACFSSIGAHQWKLITNELSAKESSFHGLKNLIYKWFERFSDWTVCNSDRSLNMWKGYYPHYSHKLSRIYNPIIMDAKVVPPSHEDKITLVVVASYQFLKNPLRFIEAVNRLSDSDKDRLCVQWYGRKEPSKNETQPYLEATALVKKYHLEKTISLNDETKRIYEIMSQADVVGLFSTVEGLPNVILEGMALAKPVIMSTVSDYNVFITEDNGFLCDPCDVESIKKALQDILKTSKEQRIAMGKVSKQIAETLFNKETIIDQWIDLIHSLVNHHE